MKSYKTLDKPLSTVNEPAAVYGSVNYFALANSRITKDYIKSTLMISKLSIPELIDIIPISIDSYKRKSVFSPAVTEKVLEIEEVYRTGLDAFGDGFYTWMNTKNTALGGLLPKDLLKNSFGVRRLLNQIGRMQYGVLA